MTAEGPGFFDELGIESIVWVDDKFDTTEDLNEVDIAELIAFALQAGTIRDHPSLSDLTNDDSPQEWARNIKERLKEKERKEFLEAIKPPEGQTAGELADYSTGEIDIVASSLGGTIRRVGLKAWTGVKEEIIASMKQGVFLVDRELALGGERTNVGDEIVRELVQRCNDNVLVIVLTHSVAPGGEEKTRNDLAEELGVEVSRIGVVSKRPQGGDLSAGIRAAVRVALMQLTCMGITNRIVRVMRTSLDETEVALRALPVGEVDVAVFENSLVEGASEVDVLTRILMSRERIAVDAHIGRTLDEVDSALGRLRKLRLLESLPSMPASDASLLREWRRDEVLDAGPRLNGMLSPIGCGDVFRKESSHYYVLLGQPCDLIVRPDGSRAAQEAVFVKLIAGYTPRGEGHRFFEVPALTGIERWALDFRAWASVNLECVEWASFNKDGAMSLHRLTELPVGLLPGWQKRFSRAKDGFQRKRQYRLSLGQITPEVAIASADHVAFPYNRVARLRVPWAASAYAAFATFHARAAFEHDFAKGLESPN